MSRIGKIPIALPKDVKINIDGSTLKVEGAKGKLDFHVPQSIKVEQKDGQLVINRLADTKQARANHGTVRAILNNMIIGVTKGHKKELEIQGLGFRATMQGTKIIFNLGLSHNIEFPIPADLKIQVPSQTSIIIEGPDKTRVGHIASQIRSFKKVEPYKGKGIRYVGEFVRRKQGKSVAK